MRVLLTTDTVGGVWTFTASLTEGLLQRGHRVALVSFGRTPSPAQQIWVQAVQANWAERFQFTPGDAPLEWMERNADALDQGAPILHRVAAHFNPEIVHASQFCWGALLFAAPIVLTAHSDVLSWAQACRPDGFEDSEWLRVYVRLVTQGLANASAVVAPTHWMLSALQENFAVTGCAGVVLNGTDLPQAQLPAPTRELRAICVGRIWDEGKAMALLSEGPWPVPVAIAGEERLEGTAGAQIEGVQALGSLGRADLVLALQASAIYLCTSIYEPFGLAAVEAALCGCAVICRDIASLREVWGDAALYFHDAEELRTLLQRLSADPEQLALQQTRAMDRAQRYPADAMVDGYLAVYSHLLAHKTQTEPLHA